MSRSTRVAVALAVVVLVLPAVAEVVARMIEGVL